MDPIIEPIDETMRGGRGGDEPGTHRDEPGMLGEVESTFAEQREALAEGAGRLAQQAREWVSEHPTEALGLAVALGFIAGRVARR